MELFIYGNLAITNESFGTFHPCSHTGRPRYNERKVPHNTEPLAFRNEMRLFSFPPPRGGMILSLLEGPGWPHVLATMAKALPYLAREKRHFLAFLLQMKCCNILPFFLIVS